jgi:hypothetical protein
VRYFRTLIIFLFVAVVGPSAYSQEMEPYAYAPNPVGANFFLAAYGEAWGEILFDPALPITDVNASWHSVTIAYGRTFGLFGRSANFAIAAPYVAGDVSGNVDENFREITRTGFADPRIRFGINLIGGPALSLQEFLSFQQKTTLGLTFIAAPPTGRYFADKLINIGSNRWSFKTELGLSHPVNKWRWELAAGVWMFTDNDDFFGGQTRKQNPIGTFQGHLIYTFKPRFWLAFDANWYRGGTTELGGVGKADLQSTSRFGATIAYPINASQSIKATYSDGAATRIGGAFQQVSLQWQYLWF